MESGLYFKIKQKKPWLRWDKQTTTPAKSELHPGKTGVWWDSIS